MYPTTGTGRWVEINRPTAATNIYDNRPLHLPSTDEFFHDRALRALGDRMAQQLADHCECGRQHRLCEWCTLPELWWQARRDKTLHDLVKLRAELDD